MPFKRRVLGAPEPSAPEPPATGYRGPSLWDFTKDKLLGLGESAVEKGVEGLDWLSDPTSTRAKIGESAIDVLSRTFSPIGKALGRVTPDVSIPEPVKQAGQFLTTPIEPLKRRVEGMVEAITPDASRYPQLSAFTQGAGEAASEMTTPIDVATTAIPVVGAGVKGARGASRFGRVLDEVMGTLGRQAEDARRLRNTTEVVTNAGQRIGTTAAPLPRANRILGEVPYQMADDVDALSAVESPNVLDAGAMARNNRAVRFAREGERGGTGLGAEFVEQGGEADFNMNRLPPSFERMSPQVQTSFSRAKIRPATEVVEAEPQPIPQDFDTGIDRYMPNVGAGPQTEFAAGAMRFDDPLQVETAAETLTRRGGPTTPVVDQTPPRFPQVGTPATVTNKGRGLPATPSGIAPGGQSLNDVLMSALESVRREGRPVPGPTRTFDRYPPWQERLPLEPGAADEVADTATGLAGVTDEVTPEESPARIVQRILQPYFGLYSDQIGRGTANMLRPGERTIDLANEYAQRELGPGFRVTSLNKTPMPSGKDELAKALRQRGHIDTGESLRLRSPETSPGGASMSLRKGTPETVEVEDVYSPAAERPGESGSAELDLLKTLAGVSGGALTGSLADPENNPVRGGIVGALLGGALGSGGVRGVLRARRGSMLSGMALPKSIAGNVGAVGGEALESALSGEGRRAVDIIKEAFRLPTNAREFADAWRGEAKLVGGNAAGYQPGSGPLDLIGRAMGSLDVTTRRALQRAGLTEEQAAEAVLTSDPRSRLGRFYVNGPEEGLGRDIYNEALPFRKTATNVAERGVERLPFGIGALVRRGRAPLRRRLAESAAGTGAFTLGAGSEDINQLSPAERGLLIAMAGRYAVPFALGTGAMRPLMETMPETDPLQGLQATRTAEENAAYLLKRYLRSFVPPDLR